MIQPNFMYFSIIPSVSCGIFLCIGGVSFKCFSYTCKSRHSSINDLSSGFLLLLFGAECHGRGGGSDEQRPTRRRAAFGSGVVHDLGEGRAQRCLTVRSVSAPPASTSMPATTGAWPSTLTRPPTGCTSSTSTPRVSSSTDHSTRRTPPPTPR